MTLAFDLIVGLGNPGAKYEHTRHNAGFWLLDRLAESAGVSFREETRFQGQVAVMDVAGQSCRLLKPSTFMNRSGQSVAALLRFYKTPPGRLLVVHDDIDLEPGCIRLKRGGGHGGHNGLRDIIQVLGSRDFCRLRIGVGHPGDRDQVVDYVLRRPAPAEREVIGEAIDCALTQMPAILQGDLEGAMRVLHARG